MTALSYLTNQPAPSEPPAFDPMQMLQKVSLGTAAAPPTGHIAHVLNTADNMGGPVAPPAPDLSKIMPTQAPQVQVDQNPQAEMEGHLANQLRTDWQKDADVPHGFWGKLKHGLDLATGGLNPDSQVMRHQQEAQLVNQLNTQMGDEATNAEKGANAKNQEAETMLHEQQADAAQLHTITPEMAQAYGNPSLAGEKVPAAVLQHLETTRQTVHGKEAIQKPIIDASGNQYLLDPEHPGQAIPITGPDGKPLQGQQKPVDITKKLQNEIAAAQGVGDHATVQKLQEQLVAMQPIQAMAARAGEGRAGAMEQQAGIAQNRFNADYYGIGPDRQPIPGAPMIEGQPVGFKGGLGATLTNRLAVANAVNEMKPSLDASIDAAARIGAIGPAGGRWTTFEQLLGDPSPEAQYLWAQIKSFTTLMPALHAMRSAELAQHLDQASGGLKQSPESLKAYFSGLASVTAPISSGINETRYTNPNKGNQPAQGGASTIPTGAILGETSKPDGVYQKSDGSKYRVEGGKVYAH